ncbi:hypothetical protein ECC02_010180 [Trypanosoma cruzi]|uniref:Uncharacterized protein n=1 Tax=Trypanosoma cruzi TaxID=5693 RepID=A0A7J6XRD1_TRYCR|nr:hypothetical protein ECC02_010180 [Trypanosoma cruzi]
MQYIQWAHYVCASWDEVRARVHARGHTQRVSEGRVCVRAVHGSLSLTLTRPPPQPQPQTQQQEEEAREGRWCGRPRCCRHCRQSSPLYFSWLWLRLVFPSDWLLYFHFVFLLLSLHHQLLDHCWGCRLQCYCQLHYWRHHRLPWVMVALILHGRLGRVVALARVVNPQCWTVHSLLLVVAMVLPFVFLRRWLDFHVSLLVPHDLRFLFLLRVLLPPSLQDCEV